MSNAYSALKQKHQAEVNSFPIAFAFSNEQFKKGMESLGLKEKDTDKVLSIGGGGFIRKTDAAAFTAMFKQHEKEMQAAIDSDPTGEGFIYDMFLYELGNHEYGYTYDLEPTLEALNLTYDEVQASAKLSHGLKLARKDALQEGA